MKARLEKFQPLKGKDEVTLVLTCSKSDMQEIVSLFDQPVRVERWVESGKSDLDASIDLTGQIQQLLDELVWELTKVRIQRGEL